MDSIKAEKFQAMKKYRRRSQLLYYNYLTLHHLIGAGLACALVVNHGYSFWFLCRLCSSMKHFLLTSLPCVWSSFFNPKCLFVVVNVIVLFLVGESRFVHVTTNSSPSLAHDIYSEYVERSRSRSGSRRGRQEIMKTRQQKKREEEEDEEAEMEVVNTKLRVVNMEVKEEAKESKLMKLAEKAEEKLDVISAEPKDTGVKQVEGRAVQETSEIMDEEERDVAEEGGLLPTEELNKRVEELIARVNKQWRLEAQSLVCCKA